MASRVQEWLLQPLQTSQPGQCFPQSPAPATESLGAASSRPLSRHQPLSLCCRHTAIACASALAPREAEVSQHLRFTPQQPEPLPAAALWVPSARLHSRHVGEERSGFIPDGSAQSRRAGQRQCPCSTARRASARSLRRGSAGGSLAAGSWPGQGRLRACRACRGRACGRLRSPRPRAPAAGHSPLRPRADSATLWPPPPRPAPAAAPRPGAHLPVHGVLEAVLGGSVAPNGQLQDGPWKQAGRAVGRALPRPRCRVACGVWVAAVHPPWQRDAWCLIPLFSEPIWPCPRLGCPLSPVPMGIGVVQMAASQGYSAGSASEKDTSSRRQDSRMPPCQSQAALDAPLSGLPSPGSPPAYPRGHPRRKPSAGTP